MGGGNGQKAKMARERNLEKQKGAKGSQLESNKKAMSIQVTRRVRDRRLTTQKKSDVYCEEGPRSPSDGYAFSNTGSDLVSYVRSWDTSEAENREGDPSKNRKHVNKNQNAEEEEEDDDGEYVKGGHYKDGYYYEQDPEVARVSKELHKIQ
uniref:Small EDRK-rich factor-like N-terminal domain-containing protein n=1 Tax=Cannabis sativa TaxID=3483 RepID=A0A803NJP5_CANSA